MLIFLCYSVRHIAVIVCVNTGNVFNLSFVLCMYSQKHNAMCLTTDGLPCIIGRLHIVPNVSVSFLSTVSYTSLGILLVGVSPDLQ